MREETGGPMLLEEGNFCSEGLETRSALYDETWRKMYVIPRMF